MKSRQKIKKKTFKLKLFIFVSIFFLKNCNFKKDMNT